MCGCCYYLLCLLGFFVWLLFFYFFFFFNDTATTEIYTLSLHDALPISTAIPIRHWRGHSRSGWISRSEEHTSELQSRGHLVCRLLLEKKKKKRSQYRHKKQSNNRILTQLSTPHT